MSHVWRQSPQDSLSQPCKRQADMDPKWRSAVASSERVRSSLTRVGPVSVDVLGGLVWWPCINGSPMFIGAISVRRLSRHLGFINCTCHAQYSDLLFQVAYISVMSQLAKSHALRERGMYLAWSTMLVGYPARRVIDSGLSLTYAIGYDALGPWSFWKLHCTRADWQLKQTAKPLSHLFFLLWQREHEARARAWGRSDIVPWSEETGKRCRKSSSSNFRGARSRGLLRKRRG